jgi:hypothetical protein
MVFVTRKLELIALLDEFFGTRKVGFFSELEVFHECFFLLERVNNAVDFSFGGLNSFF